MACAIPTWDQFRTDLRRVVERSDQDPDRVLADCDATRRAQHSDPDIRLWPGVSGRSRWFPVLRTAYPDRAEGLVRRMQSLLVPRGRVDPRWQTVWELPDCRRARSEPEIVALAEFWELLRVTGTVLRDEHLDPLDDVARVRVTRWGDAIRKREATAGSFDAPTVRSALDASLSRVHRDAFPDARRLAALLARHSTCCSVVGASVPFVWGF